MTSKTQRVSAGHRILQFLLKFIYPDGDGWLKWTLGALILFGVLMGFSTNLGRSLANPAGFISMGIKTILYALLAWSLGICVFSWWWNLKKYAGRQWLILGIYIFFLILVAVMSEEINGSKAWLIMGPISLQPSEFGKPLTIFCFAVSMYWASKDRKRNGMTSSWWKLFQWPLIFSAINLAFIMAAQSDLGTAIITGAIMLCGLLIPAYPCASKFQKIILWLFIGVFILIIITVYLTDWAVKILEAIGYGSHIIARIQNMKNPYIDLSSDGYQPANALYAIADSGFWGKGLGASARKYGYLTQAESDYILAVVIEELGIFGFLGVTAAYGIVLWRLVYYAGLSRKLYNRMLLSLSAVYIAMHYIVNIGGVAGIMPMTGVPLLFVSAGGSSILAVSITMGACLKTTAQIMKDREEQ